MDGSRLSMKDVGNRYVKILLMGSFFQDVSVDEFGDITTFKMHDLMHDLATSVAGNDCYLDCEGKGVTGRPMHVSFLSHNGVYSLSSLNASKLRTILGLKIQDEFVANSSIILHLKCLRVLNLSKSSITKLPKFLGKFKHLRHLDLTYCEKLISLPESIGNLVMLQTLKLEGCHELVFCVKVITKLTSLRHLHISYCKAFEKMMPAGLGKITSLESLSDFVVGDGSKSESAKLNELRDLNDIRGYIRILNLNLVRDVSLESQEANLKAKTQIRRLLLVWERETKNSDSLQLLDNLCPHENLRELEVSGYPGVRFSSWLPSLTNVAQISLYSLPNCQCLPPLERLPSLETLRIWEMKELKCMHYEEVSHLFFPYLKTLFLRNCENLKGWQRLGDDDDDVNDTQDDLSLPHFPCLSSLTIEGCPNLTCMPTLPHDIIERLELRDHSIKPLIETCSVHHEPSSFNRLSSLKKLSIRGVLRRTEAVAEEWMQNLTSLKRLSIRRLSLLRHLQWLRSELEELEITYVDDDKLDLWEYEGDNRTQCHGPPHALRSLQKLSILYCSNMKALPEQIGDLKSLRHIEIVDCPKLESLPEAMRCLTNLQTLSIRYCRLLRDRCRAETGQDWPKIANIQNIVIDGPLQRGSS